MDEIDIPEAIREEGDLSNSSRSSLSSSLIIGIILCLGVGIILLTFMLFKGNQAQDQGVSKLSQPSVTPKTANNTLSAKKSTPVKPVKENLLGHLPYQIAPESQLKAITADGSLKMRPAAAEKFLEMQAAARAEGIMINPISAFRTIESQEQLFFKVKEQKVQNATKRAEVSAPPGYSEHHTGYAIDIGDGNAPATNLETDFAKTPVFAWLEKNAPKYSFELSFPLNNEQGVSYEPWHWRFVGDRHSLETFYKARN
ncbi:peptidase M15B and M15C, D,D-carboxypeptidase VanY/endolysin [Chondrocystis sp. NIES-4102]|nr:peptidase M15B and M15C, D,D-carboxypeptidase VanY/endolysin [Chondrocystis sp. NIES-4102]